MLSGDLQDVASALETATRWHAAWLAAAVAAAVEGAAAAAAVLIASQAQCLIQLGSAD